MKKFSTLFLSLVLCVMCCTGCATKLEKQVLKASKDLTNYMMDINYDNHELQVSQTIDYINSSNDVFDMVYLHLYPNNFRQGAVNPPVSSLNISKAYPNGFSEGGVNISQVSVNDVKQDVKLKGDDDDILEVTANISPKERVSIDIEYSVKIPNCLHRFGYGDNTINLGNFYPIMAVYDGEWKVDPYHSNGDPFYSESANYYVNICAPSSMVLANTGNVEKTIQEGNRNYYEITAKAVRDFAFVLSNKFSVASEQYENVNVKYYYYDDDNFAQGLKSAIDSIKTFNKLFGNYPYSTYSVVKANFLHGGMEYPNLVLISDDVTDYNDYVNVIIHETAHQWWYGLIGNDEYSYGWLDEGLTDYSTALFYKYNENYGIKYQEIMKNTTNSYVNFVEVYTKVLGGVDTTMNRKLNEYNTEPEYVYMAYVKGALLFDSIRENLGEERMLMVLKKYFENFRFKIATPNDLVYMFEKYAGYEMRGFFDSWINGQVVIKRVD